MRRKEKGERKGLRKVGRRRGRNEWTKDKMTNGLFSEERRTKTN